MQLSFGSGALWGERTDVVGSGIGPRQFGILQDVQIDVTFTEKKLYGQFQFPQAIARGTGDFTGTAKFAQIMGLLYSDIFFGVTPTLGQLAVSQLEANLIPNLTPFTVVVTHANAFHDDLGVVYATGGRFNRVTTPSGPGQYSVNLGSYNFSSADANTSILIAYTYNVTTSGTLMTITNPLMGVTPTFKMTLSTLYGGESATLRLNACTASKLTLPTRLDDWTIQNLEFSALADASGIIGVLSSLE